MGFRIYPKCTKEELEDFKARMKTAGYDMCFISYSWWDEMMKDGLERFYSFKDLTNDEVKNLNLYITADPFIKMFRSISVDMGLGWTIY